MLIDINERALLRLFSLEYADLYFAAFIRAAVHAGRVKAKGIVPIIINRDDAAIAFHGGQGGVDEVISRLSNRLF